MLGVIIWMTGNVMKWIGHSPHSLGEQNAESKIPKSWGFSVAKATVGGARTGADVNDEGYGQ